MHEGALWKFQMYKQELSVELRFVLKFDVEEL